MGLQHLIIGLAGKVMMNSGSFRGFRGLLTVPFPESIEKTVEKLELHRKIQVISDSLHLAGL